MLNVSLYVFLHVYLVDDGKFSIIDLKTFKRT